jgi:hypothetical protein
LGSAALWLIKDGMGILSNARVSMARKMHVGTTTTVASVIRIHRGFVKMFQEFEDFIQAGFDPAIDASMLKNQRSTKPTQIHNRAARRISISSFPLRSRKPCRIWLDSMLCERANSMGGDGSSFVTRGKLGIRCALAKSCRTLAGLTCKAWQ